MWILIKPLYIIAISCWVSARSPTFHTAFQDIVTRLFFVGDSEMCAVTLEKGVGYTRLELLDLATVPVLLFNIVVYILNIKWNMWNPPVWAMHFSANVKILPLCSGGGWGWGGAIHRQVHKCLMQHVCINLKSEGSWKLPKRLNSKFLWLVWTKNEHECLYKQCTTTFLSTRVVDHTWPDQSRVQRINAVGSHHNLVKITDKL